MRYLKVLLFIFISIFWLNNSFWADYYLTNTVSFFWDDIGSWNNHLIIWTYTRNNQGYFWNYEASRRYPTPNVATSANPQHLQYDFTNWWMRLAYSYWNKYYVILNYWTWDYSLSLFNWPPASLMPTDYYVVAKTHDDLISADYSSNPTVYYTNFFHFDDSDWTIHFSWYINESVSADNIQADDSSDIFYASWFFASTNPDCINVFTDDFHWFWTVDLDYNILTACLSWWDFDDYLTDRENTKFWYMYFPATNNAYGVSPNETLIIHERPDLYNLYDITVVDCKTLDFDYSTCNVLATWQVNNTNLQIMLTWWGHLYRVKGYWFPSDYITFDIDSEEYHNSYKISTVSDSSSYDPTYFYWGDPLLLHGELVETWWVILTWDYVDYNYENYEFSSCNSSQLKNTTFTYFTTWNTAFENTWFSTEYWFDYISNLITDFWSVELLHNTIENTWNILVFEDIDLKSSYLTIWDSIKWYVNIIINDVTFNMWTEKVFILYSWDVWNMNSWIARENRCNMFYEKDIFFDKDLTGDLEFWYLENLSFSEDRLLISSVLSWSDYYIYYLSVFKYLDDLGDPYYLYFYWNKKRTSSVIEDVESQIIANLANDEALVAYEGFFSCDRNVDGKTSILEYSMCWITLAQKTFWMLRDWIVNFWTTLSIITQLGDVEKDELFWESQTLTGINEWFSELFNFESSNNPWQWFYIFIKYVIYTCFVFVILVILFV